MADRGWIGDENNWWRLEIRVVGRWRCALGVGVMSDE